MANWRVAESLLTLRDEVDRRSPDRSKVSDGTIGNAAHQSRDSDHNPWVKDGDMGVVTAMDITNDPEHGFDSSDFADWLRERCKDGTENRVKYVISDRRIASASLKPGHKHWDWRPYDGPNAHLHHVHVSVYSTKSRYDNTSPWGWYTEEDDVTEKELKDAIRAVLQEKLVDNVDATGKVTGKMSLIRADDLGDQKLDFIKATVRAIQTTVTAQNKVLTAIAANSPDAIRAATDEFVAKVKAELADIDVQVTLGDRTDGTAR